MRYFGPHSVNYLDIILIIPLLWGLYKGFTKGFIIEVASLVALGLGVWGSIHFSDYTGSWLQEQFELTTEWLPVLAFAVTFIGIVVGVYALAKVLERVVNLVAMKFVNKLAGAVFGALKLGLIASILLVFVDAVDQRFAFMKQEDKQASVLYEPVLGLAGTIIPGVRNSDVMEYLDAAETQLAEEVEQAVHGEIQQQLTDSLSTAD